MNFFQKLTLTYFLPLSSAAVAQAAELELTVSNVQLAQGSIQVAVFNSEETYNSGKPVISKSIQVTGDDLDISLPELTDGDYAIKFVHD